MKSVDARIVSAMPNKPRGPRGLLVHEYDVSLTGDGLAAERDVVCSSAVVNSPPPSESAGLGRCSHSPSLAQRALVVVQAA
jgi:hypothetical protein